MKKLLTFFIFVISFLFSTNAVQAAPTAIFGLAEHTFYMGEKVRVTISTKQTSGKYTFSSGQIKELSAVRAEFADATKCGVTNFSPESPTNFTANMTYTKALSTACRALITKYMDPKEATRGLQTFANVQYDNLVITYLNNILKVVKGLDFSNNGNSYLFVRHTGYSATGSPVKFIQTAGRMCGNMTSTDLRNAVAKVRADFPWIYEDNILVLKEKDLNTIALADFYRFMSPDLNKSKILAGTCF